MKLIHYGASEYKEELFQPIVNSDFRNKPESGGLWTSPIYSTCSWKDFAVWVGFMETEKCFEIELSQDAKIYKIDSKEDLYNSKYLKPIDNETKKYYFDFEHLAKDYDALWLTENGMKDTYWNDKFDMYGWDVETVLVLNKEVIKEK